MQFVQKFHRVSISILSFITGLTLIICSSDFALSADSPQSASIERNLPSYYIYHGQRVELELRSNQLAVTLRNSSKLDRLMPGSAALGVDFSSAEFTGAAGKYLVELSVPVSDVYQADQQITSLLSNPEISFASPVFQGLNNTWITMTPEILLQFKPEYQGQAEVLLKELAPELDIVQKDFGHLPGAYRLKSSFSNGFEVLAVANRLAEDYHFHWAEPNAFFSGGAALIPNDTYFSSLWGILNTGQFSGTPDRDMDGDSAWDYHTGDAGIKVLILDVGVQQDHPDINQLPGADFTGEGGGGGPVNACDKHGTAVAGCVSAIINNSLGVVGIAPGCKSLSARPFISNLSCDGSWSTSASWTVDALDWGEQQGARVSNNSNYYGFTSSAIEAKYNSTWTNGMVHFAAAGNFSSYTITYPASIPIVNAIAALQPNGTLASFSNKGNGLDFCAPGQTIYSTDQTGVDGYVSGDYVIINGTSFASPYSAGVAALILSQNSGLTSAQVEDIMKCSAQDLGATGYEILYGWGQVNAENALLNTPESDADTDGFADQCDVCPNYFNPLQIYAKAGDANASNNYTLSDVIAIVNYVFSKPGCMPEYLCWLTNLLCRGDWNASANVTLSDVVQAVNYVFNKPGGPWSPLPVSDCCVPYNQ